jgi:hypothetical protein
MANRTGGMGSNMKTRTTSRIAGAGCLWALVAALLSAGAAPVPALAAGEAPPAAAELTRLQSACEDGLRKLATDQTKAVASLQGQYTNALALLEKKTQDAGDLDRVVAIRKERDRFSAQKTVGDGDVSPDVPELGKLQKNYVERLREAALGKARDTIRLVQQIDKSLASLEQSLTRQGDTASALDVRNARDLLGKRPEVSEARSVVAEADSRRPREPEQAQPPATAAGTPQPSNKVDKANGTAGARKYAAGKAAAYVKQRFLKLYEALYAGDRQTARGLVDPGYLKKEGEGAVDRQLEYILGGCVSLMKEPDNGKTKADAMRIKVDDKEEAATLVPRLFALRKWYEQPATYWMQVDGDWYLDIYTDIKKGGTSRAIDIGAYGTTRNR